MMFDEECYKTWKSIFKKSILKNIISSGKQGQIQPAEFDTSAKDFKDQIITVLGNDIPEESMQFLTDNWISKFENSQKNTCLRIICALFYQFTIEITNQGEYDVITAETCMNKLDNITKILENAPGSLNKEISIIIKPILASLDNLYKKIENNNFKFQIFTKSLYLLCAAYKLPSQIIGNEYLLNAFRHIKWVVHPNDYYSLLNQYIDIISIRENIISYSDFIDIASEINLSDKNFDDCHKIIQKIIKLIQNNHIQWTAIEFPMNVEFYWKFIHFLIKSTEFRTTIPENAFERSTQIDEIQEIEITYEIRNNTNPIQLNELPGGKSISLFADSSENELIGEIFNICSIQKFKELSSDHMKYVFERYLSKIDSISLYIAEVLLRIFEVEGVSPLSSDLKYFLATKLFSDKFTDFTHEDDIFYQQIMSIRDRILNCFSKIKIEKDDFKILEDFGLNSLYNLIQVIPFALNNINETSKAPKDRQNNTMRYYTIWECIAKQIEKLSKIERDEKLTKIRNYLVSVIFQIVVKYSDQILINEILDVMIFLLYEENAQDAVLKIISLSAKSSLSYKIRTFLENIVNGDNKSIPILQVLLMKVEGYAIESIHLDMLGQAMMEAHDTKLTEAILHFIVKHLDSYIKFDQRDKSQEIPNFMSKLEIYKKNYEIGTDLIIKHLKTICFRREDISSPIVLPDQKVLPQLIEILSDTDQLVELLDFLSDCCRFSVRNTFRLITASCKNHPTVIDYIISKLKIGRKENGEYNSLQKSALNLIKSMCNVTVSNSTMINLVNLLDPNNKSMRVSSGKSILPDIIDLVKVPKYFDGCFNLYDTDRFTVTFPKSNNFTFITKFAFEHIPGLNVSREILNIPGLRLYVEQDEIFVSTNSNSIGKLEGDGPWTIAFSLQKQNLKDIAHVVITIDDHKTEFDIPKIKIDSNFVLFGEGSKANSQPVNVSYFHLMKENIHEMMNKEDFSSIFLSVNPSTWSSEGKTSLTPKTLEAIKPWTFIGVLMEKDIDRPMQSVNQSISQIGGIKIFTRLFEYSLLDNVENTNTEEKIEYFCQVCELIKNLIQDKALESKFLKDKSFVVLGQIIASFPSEMFSQSMFDSLITIYDNLSERIQMFKYIFINTEIWSRIKDNDFRSNYITWASQNICIEYLPHLPSIFQYILHLEKEYEENNTKAIEAIFEICKQKLQDSFTLDDQLFILNMANKDRNDNSDFSLAILNFLYNEVHSKYPKYNVHIVNSENYWLHYANLINQDLLSTITQELDLKYLEITLKFLIDTYTKFDTKRANLEKSILSVVSSTKWNFSKLPESTNITNKLIELISSSPSNLINKVNLCLLPLFCHFAIAMSQSDFECFVFYIFRNSSVIAQENDWIVWVLYLLLNRHYDDCYSSMCDVIGNIYCHSANSDAILSAINSMFGYLTPFMDGTLLAEGSDGMPLLPILKGVLYRETRCDKLRIQKLAALALFPLPLNVYPKAVIPTDACIDQMFPYDFQFTPRGLLWSPPKASRNTLNRAFRLPMLSKLFTIQDVFKLLESSWPEESNPLYQVYCFIAGYYIYDISQDELTLLVNYLRLLISHKPGSNNDALLLGFLCRDEEERRLSLDNYTKLDNLFSEVNVHNSQILLEFRAAWKLQGSFFGYDPRTFDPEFAVNNIKSIIDNLTNITDPVKEIFNKVKAKIFNDDNNNVLNNIEEVYSQISIEKLLERRVYKKYEKMMQMAECRNFVVKHRLDLALQNSSTRAKIIRKHQFDEDSIKITLNSQYIKNKNDVLDSYIKFDQNNCIIAYKFNDKWECHKFKMSKVSYAFQNEEITTIVLDDGRFYCMKIQEKIDKTANDFILRWIQGEITDYEMINLNNVFSGNTSRLLGALLQSNDSQLMFNDEKGDVIIKNPIYSTAARENILSIAMNLTQMKKIKGGLNMSINACNTKEYTNYAKMEYKDLLNAKFSFKDNNISEIAISDQVDKNAKIPPLLSPKVLDKATSERLHITAYLTASGFVEVFDVRGDRVSRFVAPAGTEKICLFDFVPLIATMQMNSVIFHRISQSNDRPISTIQITDNLSAIGSVEIDGVGPPLFIAFCKSKAFITPIASIFGANNFDNFAKIDLKDGFVAKSIRTFRNKDSVAIIAIDFQSIISQIIIPLERQKVE